MLRRILKRLLLILGLSLLLLLSDGIWTPLSRADIRQYHNGNGDMLDQARHSLRDIDRRPWQVVVFRDVKNGVAGHLELRLVGFPTQIDFQHPQPLLIQTRSGQDFQAPDEFGDNGPAANVGQYDITEILPRLPQDEPLVLELPTVQRATLKVPASVISEWRLIS
ncbi:hypothetical protein NIES208_07180 [[Limnothrix rosea] IAM M-220]|nr:hypothetical protein NIES208_07180 [[Limnothrix rosea] IAM M-220]